MFSDQLDNPSEAEPLDPSRVVPYHHRGDSPVDNDLRISPPPASGTDTSHSLWAAGLLSKPAPAQSPSSPSESSHWLAGLIQEEKQSSAPAPRRSWTSSWTTDELPVEEGPTPATSWLAGLVMEENKRPALQDIARLLLGDSGVRAAPSFSPSPASLQPVREEENEAEGAPPHPGGDFAPPGLAQSRQPEQDAASPRNLPLPKETPKATQDSPPLQDSSEQSQPTAGSEPPGSHRSRAATSGVQETPPFVPQPVTRPRGTPLPRGLAENEGTLATTPALEPPGGTRTVKKTAAEPERSVRPAPVPAGRIAHRDRVSFYRSVATMFHAGVPLFAIFEFLSREGESLPLCLTCRRIGQNLVSGMSLPIAARQEPHLFDLKAARMLEAGYRGGQLGEVLVQLAEDEEQAWKLRQTVQAQLVYPCGIALMTLAAVVLLPPLVLTDLLSQVVSLTSRPPLLSVWLLKISALLSSPWTLAVSASVLGGLGLWLRSARGRAVKTHLEPVVWFVPALGPLWRNIVALRFLRVFAMTYRAGLMAPVGLELAVSATGSQLAYRVVPLMRKALLEGGTLSDSFAAGGFLPGLALEAVKAGESAGKVPLLLENTATILAVEVESRIEAVAKLVEPLVLACLGAFVAIFVLGCLLPIVELTSTL